MYSQAASQTEVSTEFQFGLQKTWREKFGTSASVHLIEGVHLIMGSA